jgi:hypothetical protein
MTESDRECDEHELFYELISTNMPESYKRTENAAGYALDFERIVSAKPWLSAKS